MLEFRVGLSPYISPIVLDTIAQNSRAGGRFVLCVGAGRVTFFMWLWSLCRKLSRNFEECHIDSTVLS